MPQLFPAFLASTLALAACSPLGTDMTQPESAAASQADAPERPPSPRYRKNPQPTRAYRIEMTLEHAPGPFAHVLGLAQFDVVNPECLPPPDDNPGGYSSPVPTEGVEIALQKVSDNTYSGLVYADQMLDEDYYGRGVCHWALKQAQVQLKATGAETETKFLPSLRGEDVLAGASRKIHLPKRVYPRGKVEDYPEFGQTDRSQYAVPDEDLFSVDLSAKQEAP